MSNPFRVRIELSEEQAMPLAQFVKRVGWSHMRECAVDDDEACEIRAAIEALQRELAHAGFAPR